jgi:flagellar hook-basal body complex protein FliE
MPVDPSFAVSGPEWQIAPVEPVASAAGDGGAFGSLLGDAMRSLAATQAQAAAASQDLAAGRASDPTAAVMAVERAQLAMQLAGQLRTKGVEAIQDLFHTQV